jgi:hypothetical protein
MLLAAATLLTTILTGSANADTSVGTAGTTTTASHHHGWTKLALTVYAPRRHDSTTVVLECQPAGGTHPHPRRACLEVKVARGDFDHLPGTPGMTACTMEFRPVVASVRGLWRGEWVRWHQRYANPCAMRAETGAVFNF